MRASRGDEAVRIDDVLLGGSLVEVVVALRCILERDDGGVDRRRDVRPVVQDRHHQLAVVRHHRALASDEVVRLRPAEAETHPQRPGPGFLVDAAWVARHVQPGDPEASAGPRDGHDVVEDGRWCLARSRAVALGLEADAVDRGVNFGLAQDLGDLVGAGRVLAQVDGLAAETAGLGQPLRVHVTDDDDGRTEDLRGVRGRQPHGASAGDVHRGAGGDAGGVRAVITGGEDVREHGEIADLLHGLVLVGELQQVEVRVGNHDVLGLAADPATHVDVAVRRAGTVRVDVQADAGLALLAVAAVAAGDVERHAAVVADLDELHARAGLDNLAGDLVAEHEAFGGGRAAAHHVLVAAADVGRDDLEDHAVRAFPSHVRWVDPGAVLQFQLRVVNGLDLDLARSEIDNGTVSWHHIPPRMLRHRHRATAPGFLQQTRGWPPLAWRSASLTQLPYPAVTAHNGEKACPGDRTPVPAVHRD